MSAFALCCMVFAAGCFIGWILKWCAVSDQMGELKKTHRAELRKVAGYNLFRPLSQSKMVDLEPEFSDMIDEKFWDLIDTNEREGDA